MTDKKIAVHVTNEEQWNEVKDYYGFHWVNIDAQESDFFIRIDTDVSLGCANDGWALDKIGYSILEFNEWQAGIKEDNAEKIEVPQAVYDEFIILSRKFETVYSFLYRVWGEGKFYNNLHNYIFSDDEIKLHQLNIAKVMAGEAEFVPIEEAYYWQEKQGRWLGYVDNGSIAIFVNKNMADKITESEIREKTSFNINKLKKVSE